MRLVKSPATMIGVFHLRTRSWVVSIGLSVEGLRIIALRLQRKQKTRIIPKTDQLRYKKFRVKSPLDFFLFIFSTSTGIASALNIARGVRIKRTMSGLSPHK